MLLGSVSRDVLHHADRPVLVATRRAARRARRAVEYAWRVEAATPSEPRLRALVEAGIALTSELSLDALLQRLTEVAAELTGARYAALGVIDRRARSSSASSPTASTTRRTPRSATCPAAAASSAC